MELFEHIRRARREEGVSIRELARRQHVHRRTVRQALQSALVAIGLDLDQVIGLKPGHHQGALVSANDTR